MLRLEGGAEYYVPVFARYASQEFGTPLEQLSSKHGSQVLSCCPLCHTGGVHRVILLLSYHDVHYVLVSTVPCRCCRPSCPSFGCFVGQVWLRCVRYLGDGTWYRVKRY